MSLTLSIKSKFSWGSQDITWQNRT